MPKEPFLYYVRVFWAFFIVIDSKYFDIPPQILWKIFENHLSPRKKYRTQTNINLLEYVKVQCLHLYSLIMWQMIWTKHIFHKKSFDSKITDSNYDYVII